MKEGRVLYILPVTGTDPMFSAIHIWAAWKPLSLFDTVAKRWQKNNTEG